MSEQVLDRYEQLHLKEGAYLLLADAIAQDIERRKNHREPFFCSAHIELNGKSYSVFTRDISEEGAGLLHSMRLMPGRMNIAITRFGTEVIRFEIDLNWCEPAGEGWYLSGCRFVRRIP